MNILFLVSSMHAGGAERVAAVLSNHWAGSGHRVTLMATFSGHGDCVYTLDERVDLVYLSTLTGAVPGWRSRFAGITRLLALRRFIAAQQPDVIVSFLTNVNVAALLANCGQGIPIIACEHTHPPMYPMGRMWEALRRWTYPWAHRVVMLTQDGLAWLRQEVPAAHGYVIPNPVIFPLPVAPPHIDVGQHIGAQRRLVLAVGRMDEGKQFDRLIAAFHALHADHPDWDLAILGEGPLRSQLQQQIDTLKLAPRVCMPGRAGNIGHWYARAELYVLSSRFEGFPNVVGEAMSHGCPVVSYDCDTGPRDIIRDGVDGLLVRPVGDIPALASAMRALMGDEVKRQALAREARLICQVLGIEQVAARWDAVFSSAKR